MDRYYVCEPTTALTVDRVNGILAQFCEDTGEVANLQKVWRTPFGFEINVYISGSYLRCGVRRGAGGKWLFYRQLYTSSSDEINMINISENMMTIGSVASNSSYGMIVLFKSNSNNYCTMLSGATTYSSIPDCYKFAAGLDANGIKVDGPLYSNGLINGNPVINDTLIDGHYSRSIRLFRNFAITLQTGIEPLTINGVTYLGVTQSSTFVIAL